MFASRQATGLIDDGRETRSTGERHVFLLSLPPPLALPPSLHKRVEDKPKPYPELLLPKNSSHRRCLFSCQVKSCSFALAGDVYGERGWSKGAWYASQCLSCASPSPSPRRPPHAICIVTLPFHYAFIPAHSSPSVKAVSHIGPFFMGEPIVVLGLWGKSKSICGGDKSGRELGGLNRGFGFTTHGGCSFSRPYSTMAPPDKTVYCRTGWTCSKEEKREK